MTFCQRPYSLVFRNIPIVSDKLELLNYFVTLKSWAKVNKKRINGEKTKSITINKLCAEIQSI